ncbi:MAG: VWA domain-containing protein [Victivallales bacterium]|nr:VWA domain-containing protein [Victivallales bacterium]
MMRFEMPWAFLLLLLPCVIYALRRRFRRGALRFSSLASVKAAGHSWRVRFSFMPLALQLLAFLLLVIALARPQAGNEKIQNISQGVAIEMLLDRSTSMSLFMQDGGGARQRFELAKKVFNDFVFGNGADMNGRKEDLVGLVTFARYADTICPLTLSHEVLRPFLNTVKMAEIQEEDGTAIGDALMLAAARLHTVEENLRQQSKKAKEDYKIQSKVIILLTDGENNCGRKTVAQAGEMVAKWGIKLYVITITGDAYQQYGNRLRRVMTRPPDLQELEGIAQATGGFCKKAWDAKSLRELYSEIDKLEKSQVESTSYIDYKELCQPFMLAAFICQALALFLSTTVFRRLP